MKMIGPLTIRPVLLKEVNVNDWSNYDSSSVTDKINIRISPTP
jgi:hypothetical protein